MRVEFGLSALEQGSLLEPDMVSQPPPELPQRLRSDARVRRKVVKSAAQIGVVNPDALDIRVSGIRAGGQDGKQQLLLLADVLLPVAIPELDRRAPDGLGVGLGGAAESQPELERNVMLSREKDKLGAALHRAFLQSVGHEDHVVLRYLCATSSPDLRGRPLGDVRMATVGFPRRGPGGSRRRASSRATGAPAPEVPAPVSGAG